MKIDEKKFLSPSQLRKRFSWGSFKYHMYVEDGLPTYECAGVVRHPIDEVYLWCEENRIPMVDITEYCNKSQLKKLLGIGEDTLVKWEKLGLPKILAQIGMQKKFVYNKRDVIAWLDAQTKRTREELEKAKEKEKICQLP